MQRDSKGLYRRKALGEINDIAGLDLPFPRPSKPDLIIENNRSLQKLLSFAPIIADRISGVGL
jgi:adenylylsulfate kinase